MKIVVSLSGGKDSTAQLLHLAERYSPERLVCHYQVLPESWPETLGYVQDICQHVGVSLIAQQMLYTSDNSRSPRGVRRLRVVDVQSYRDIVQPGTDGVIAGITDLALRRGWPPSPAMRICTAMLKVRLLNWWIIQQQNDGLKLGEDVIIALGERAGESPRRAKKQELWPRPKCQRRAYRVWNWLPVHEWSRRDIFRRIRDWGLAPHPAYKAQGMTDHEMYDIDVEGGPRTSCRFCFYASQSDICHQIERDANRALWQRMLHVEHVTGKHWWPSWSAIDVEAGKIKLEPRQPLVTEQLSLF